jgi:acyl-coenzyme A thioesterase PaaI-like protein
MPRDGAAAALRAMGHEFVSHEIPEDDLAELEGVLVGWVDRLGQLPPREYRRRESGYEGFLSQVPQHGEGKPRHLWSDSIVSGGANPMGLGAYLWRDGDEAVMEVSLGKAFEGAPGRAHGGIVAALFDETMGLVLTIQRSLAFTARLEITYLAPTPVGEPLFARARLVSRDGRKLQLSATLTADEATVAEATALFIEVDPARYL